MPAYNLDPNDPKNVARLIICLIEAAGGEMRIPGQSYDGMDRARLLLVDFDRKTSEIVLRCTSESGRAMNVPAENYAWTRAAAETPRQIAQIEAQRNVQQRTMRSDEELADYETLRASEAKLAAEAAAGRIPRSPFRTMPPPSEDR